SLRAARHWLSITAAWSSSDVPAVRFGVTVGKRNARRAIDRAVVKRILREAGRHAAPALGLSCARRGLRLDVAFRLNALRDRAAPGQPTLTEWRRALRQEADALLERLGRHLAQPDA
ncbi:MAG: ribonuclease P protein component, partial [Burkholderiaceae bacterium]